MPQIPVEQATFERLQSHAKPLVDTPDSVVNRALDALEGLALEPDDCPADTKREFADAVMYPGRLPDLKHPSAAADGSSEVWVVDPNRLPDLKHTKVLAASIGERPVTPANWNSLLRALLVKAMEHFGHLDQVQRLCAIHLVSGFKDDEGYKYLAEIRISYQGVSAKVAANAVVALAQALGLSLQVDFQWRRKEQAYWPGQRARLQLPSS